MKREDVKNKIPGITDEQLNWIMQENGADINREKSAATALQTQLDNANAQLKTAQDGLKAFEGVDVAGLQEQVTKLKADMKAQAEGFAFDNALDTAILGRKGRSVKAVRALLDLDALKGSADRSTDIGKALDHEFEGTHVALGVEYARKYREKEDIIHAIQAHHGDVECKTLVACLVQAADAISASRPGARRENLENYIKRLEKLEEITSSYPGVEKSYAIQAGREVRVMVKPEQVSEDEMVILARELAKRIESELEYPGQIKVHVLRETKVVEYAK